jgi:hypothetical protein
MEEGRPVIPLYRHDGSAGPDNPLQPLQGKERVGEVLEKEADEYMVEGSGIKRQVIHVRFP